MSVAALQAKLAAEGRLVLQVKVVPKSARNEFVGEMAEGVWKVKVAAVPEKGKANAALCTFLAAEFGVAQKNVEVVSGATGTLKRVVVRRDG